MPLYLRPRRSDTHYSVARCDRCGTKRYYDDLVHDDNSPGLRVCPECSDAVDPYRLPARRNENISLKYPRPIPSAPIDDGFELETEYGDDIIFPTNLTLE